MTNKLDKYIVFEKDTIAKLSLSLNEIDGKFNLLIADIEKANQQNDILAMKTGKLEFDNEDLKLRNNLLKKRLDEVISFAISKGNFSDGIYDKHGENKRVSDALDYFRNVKIEASNL